MSEILRDRFEEFSGRVEDALEDAKPRLRGWLHLAIAPLALLAGIVLVALSPDGVTRAGSAVFAATALLLFAVSAVYHRGNWSPTTHARLRSFDHSNIFLLIAGSCTPFALLLLEGRERWTMLAIVWGGAVAGVLMKLVWTGAPRWLSAPIYIALGWAPVFFFGDFVTGAMDRYGATTGTVVITLVAVGGAFYTIGGVIYGMKRPNPWPQWFGFHEVFHTFTILAFVSHYVGVSVATYSLR